MMGVLVTLDAYNCQNMPKSKSELATAAIEAVRTAGMKPIVTSLQHFDREEFGNNMGDSVITLIVPLEESHLAIHTWPYYAFVSADLYTCGNPELAVKAMKAMERSLKPQYSELNVYERGQDVQKEGI